MDKKVCRYCGKSTGKIKNYIIADDMENPKSYHYNCILKLMYDVMVKINKK